MTDTVCVCCGWALLAVGLIGCLVPMIPGPPIAYCALFVALAVGDHSAPTWTCLAVAGVITVAVTVVDCLVPSWGAAKFKCSRSGRAGCLVGTIVGLFFLPAGVVAGPFLGALVGELAVGRRFGQSLYGAFGALVGFLVGVLLKVLSCGILAYWFYRAVTQGS